MTRDEAARLLAAETDWPVDPANLIGAETSVITRAYNGAVKKHQAILHHLLDAREVLLRGEW
jgi:hypothetical protein